MRDTDISVELANEAGEIVVLEMFGEQIGGEFVRIPHDEAVSGEAP